MAKPNRLTRSQLARILPASIFLFVISLWLRGCSSGAITVGTPGVMFARTVVHPYNGVRVFMSGKTPNRTIAVTSFTNRMGFIEIKGHDEYLANLEVRQIIWPHWFMAVIAVPPGAFWLAAELKAMRRRRRAAAGQCPQCGYSLAGNTTATCPECGAALKNPPFSAISGPVTAIEGFREDEEARVVYRLTITTLPAAPSEPLSSHVRKINEVMLRWLRLRGLECESITFVFPAQTADREAEIVSWAIKLVNQNIPEANIIQRLQLEVLIQDRAGNELKKVGIGAAA
jgi:hypothetical protein